MTAVPNLNGMFRTGYVLAGAGLAAWGLFGVDARWVKLLLLFIGGALIVEGVIGFCLGRWLLRRGRQTS